MAETKKWLLLRGLARGTGHWGSFTRKLQERFPQDHFELIDLPGNGARHHETSPLEISAYVHDLRTRCSYLQRGQSFQVLALSLGAMITVEWMRQFPHEIQRAFLVCTSSSGFSPFYDRFRLSALLRGMRLLAYKNQEPKWESLVLDLVTNDPTQRQAELPALADYSRRHPLQARNILRQMVAASRYRFPPAAPGVVSLIGSHGDRLVSPHCTQNIAKAWGLSPQMHSCSGHDIPIDAPQWLLEQLTQPSSEPLTAF